MSDGGRRRLLGALAALAASGILPAGAAAFPSQTVRIVVPYPPGGFNDRLARFLARRLRERWHRAVVVDNRPGGGTLIGTDLVAKAAPDGHTLLQAAFAFGANPGLRATLPFDPIADFAPIVLCAATPNLLVVGAGQPFASVAELIEAAHARPGGIAFGSAGPGSSSHLCIEMLEEQARIELTHVPYKGSAPALDDVMSGQIQAAFDNVPNALPHLRSGRVRALAVTSPERFALLPKIPPLADTLHDFQVSSWFGLVAPAGTPVAVVDAINQEVNGILALPRTRALFHDEGVELLGGTPGAFAAHLRSEIAKWREVARRTGASLH